MPVQEATAVHTTIQGTQAQILTASDTSAVISTGADAFTITIDTTSGDPFIIQQMIVCSSTDTSGSVNATTVTIDGDAIVGVDGAPLDDTPILTTDSTTGCLDLVNALAAGNAETHTVLASDGTSIVIAGTLDVAGDAISTVKVVALVDGSSSLTVVSAIVT